MKNLQQIVQSAAAGDKGAFSELVIRFQEMAVALAKRRLRDTGLAEDAVQEAFLMVYAQLSDLRDLSAFPAWFRRILSSCCNRLERQWQMFSPVDLDFLGEVVDCQPSPLEAMVSLQTRSMVADVLASLEGVSREACVQRYVFGRSYKEIADMLGVPQGTIKRRLNDARDKIVQKVKDQHRPVIRVGYLPVSDHLMAMVSHSIHDHQNFEIHLKKYLSWSSLASSLRGGLLDAAFIMAPLAMALRNEGLPILYVMDAHHEGSAITVRNNEMSRRTSSWRRVGMPHIVSTHGLMLSSLIEVSPKRPLSGMQAKYLGPSYLLSSLASSDIDAFLCAEPWNTKAACEGMGQIYARSKDILPGHICCILVVREEFVDKECEIFVDYLRLLRAANAYIRKAPEHCSKIQEQYTGVSAKIILEVLTGTDISFNEIEPDRSRIESLMSLALNTGVLDRPCDLDRFVRSDFI
ncbi:sigma-70 family RNA polymerase sigma factor [Desulfomonile tiedjei]|uniref:DNA-directed RNA polymerase specialized sigma subunit, sigma24 n=1 Tax=Desulfomonile tiedjei (strain ATCC 49306 / DSM 6799 / DCB-1) TaxID=706587 RepID=I4CEN5_DESTA|nr:sigma-70 family RNA polymerase sigma factor [Desulfomonile tiedjei]AFM28026.1 DNA-directed RNA polymerase specialized sigma subunit, sigma24 [Desulfomonile tiedjei DSM 6799]